MTMRDGREVFSRTIDLMTRTSQRALERAGLTASQIDRFVPHQANARMFDAVCSNLGIDRARTVSTNETHGNSSAARFRFRYPSPIKARALWKAKLLLLTAAGAGFAGGATVLRI